MNKTIILPIIAVIALIIEAVTGQKIDKATQDDVANGLTILVTAGVTIWGIFKNHKK
jgi:hypothetical protein